MLFSTIGYGRWLLAVGCGGWPLEAGRGRLGLAAGDVAGVMADS